MNQGIIAVGSNFGDREAHVRGAIEYLRSLAITAEFTEIYESPDHYGTTAAYMNAIVRLETSLAEKELNRLCKCFETEAGRTLERRRRGEVPVDIDIVVWNHEVKKPDDFKASYFKEGFRRFQENLAEVNGR